MRLQGELWCAVPLHSCEVYAAQGNELQGNRITCMTELNALHTVFLQ